MLKKQLIGVGCAADINHNVMYTQTTAVFLI